MSSDDIMNAAALENGDIAMGETLNADLLDTYGKRLNSWVKSLMAEGARLWALQQATLFLERGTAQYVLGATGDHCTNTYVRSALSADSAASDTTLDLTTFSGMSASDNLGVLLDDGTLFWTTIVGAPGATTTIANALPSAASSGSVVFSYTSKINRPQRIDSDSAFWRSRFMNDTPVMMISRTEYSQLASKGARGKIVQAFYDRQLVNGQLSVWPTPDSAADVFTFWYERILEDFDNGDDTPDFAIEWSEALILGLAHRMSMSAGMSLPDRQDLERRATQALDLAMGYDKENVSVMFEPDLR